MRRNKSSCLSLCEGRTWFIWYLHMTRITQIFKIGTLSIAWFIGVELFGLQFAISAFLLTMFLSIIDTMIGLYIARTKQIVSSRIWADGLFKKVVRLFLIAGAILFMGNMSYVVQNHTVTAFMSIWVMFLIAFRIIFEVVSLVENIAIISSTEEKKSLDWIDKTLLKIVWIGQSQIEEKIKRYTPQ